MKLIVAIGLIIMCTGCSAVVDRYESVYYKHLQRPQYLCVNGNPTGATPNIDCAKIGTLKGK